MLTVRFRKRGETIISLLPCSEKTAIKGGRNEIG